jgi:glycine oxidase
MNRSVVIVGAGIIGCAVARELAVRGVPCAVIDDRPVGGGATQASAGMLAPYVEAHEDAPLLDLAVRSLDLYDSWVEDVRRESGMDIEYRRIGTLEVARSPARAAELRLSEPHHERRWLEPGGVAREFPEIASNAGALLTPGHGYVAAPALAAALACAAERQGTVFHRASVRGVARTGASLRVATTGGDHDATTVIIAAGAWGSTIDGASTPPLRPVRGQLLRLQWPGAALSTIIWGPDCYIVPRMDGTLLVGATVEEAGFDERTTAAGVRGLLAAACELLPRASDATFLDARVGLRPATPDELPVLGSAPGAPDIVHASGHYRNGVLLAPITARLIADLIVDDRRDPALETFRPDRFT